MVEEERLSDVFDFRDGALQVEGFGKDDFEDLGEMWLELHAHVNGNKRRRDQKKRQAERNMSYFLYVDAVTSTTEDETSSHRFGKASGLGHFESAYCTWSFWRGSLDSRSPPGLLLES